MSNIFLVKIQTNVNQRKHVHNSFFSEVSHTIKSRILTIKIEVISFLYKNLFFFARLNGFLYLSHFSLQVLKSLGSYMRVFTVLD